MSYSDFTPIIDPVTNLQTCVQVAVTDTSSATKLACRTVLIKCLTQPVYIRLGTSADTVTTSSGYYMAVGDEICWNTQRGADCILAIRATSSNGVISIARGESE